VGRNVTIRNRRYINIGNGVTLQDGVTIDGLSKEGVNLGENVNIGPMTVIQASGILTRIGMGLTIGSNSGIGAFSFIGCGGGVEIGVNVIMGQYVSFHAENHNFNQVDMPIRMQGTTRKGIKIESDCWVGAKVTFVDGAVVGPGCVIAAGSVVRGAFPKNSIIAGVPAKVVGVRAPKTGQ
jgi:acetyltransferase-like isoleucine patch superfamily enzyme